MRIRVHQNSVNKLKVKLKEITGRSNGKELKQSTIILKGLVLMSIKLWNMPIQEKATGEYPTVLY